MTHLAHQFWLSKRWKIHRAEAWQGADVKTECCMVRLFSVLLALSHLVDQHFPECHLWYFVYVGTFWSFFKICQSPPPPPPTSQGRGQIIFVQLVPFATLRNSSPNPAKLPVMLSRTLLESSQLSLSLILGNEERKQEADAERRLQKQLQSKTRKRGRDGLKIWKTGTG